MRASLPYTVGVLNLPQRQSGLSAHSPLIIIKELPMCILAITFKFLCHETSKLISINSDVLPL